MYAFGWTSVLRAPAHYGGIRQRRIVYSKIITYIQEK